MLQNMEVSEYTALSVLALVFLMFTSCATTSTSNNTTSKERNYLIKVEKEVLILPPKVRFENVVKTSFGSKPKEKQPLPDEATEHKIAQWLHRIAQEESQHKGFSLTVLKKTDTKTYPQYKNAEELEDSADQLVRSNVKATTALDMLHEVCGGMPHSAVLAHYLRVKVGSQAGWKMEGVPPLWVGMSPTVNMSSSYLKAVIRDCSTGEILWQNNVFARELPNTESTDYEDAVRRIYRNLLIK